VSGKEFFRKKVTQTEYRGSKYTARHDKDSQFLDIDLKPISLDAVHYDGFKEHMHNQISRFLLKIVPEETVSKVLTDTLFKKIYKLLGIK
tara:strand:+ start:8315 stop:8584 length:270 start_codon:yes stop_codon:yes gene_type:complete